MSFIDPNAFMKTISNDGHSFASKIIRDQHRKILNPGGSLHLAQLPGQFWMIFADTRWYSSSSNEKELRSLPSPNSGVEGQRDQGAQGRNHLGPFAPGSLGSLKQMETARGRLVYYQPVV
jgi:hypothetical protein